VEDDVIVVDSRADGGVGTHVVLQEKIFLVVERNCSAEDDSSDSDTELEPAVWLRRRKRTAIL
jgi:hypothetical protein